MNLLAKIGLGVFIVILIGMAGIFLTLKLVNRYHPLSQSTLEPNGLSLGKVAILYQPGLSNQLSALASNIASEFSKKNYTVLLQTIDETNLPQADMYVVGSAAYFGQASKPSLDVLEKLSDEALVSVFTQGALPDNRTDLDQMVAAGPSVRVAEKFAVGSSEAVSEFVTKVLNK